MPKTRKPSRHLPAPEATDWTPELQVEIDSGLSAVLAEKALTARRWLKSRGWALKGGITEGWKPLFMRRVGGRAEFLKGEAPNADPRDAVCYRIFTNAEFARLASKRGDHAKAMGYAWWAGWYCAKSNVLLNEAERAGQKRRGCSNIPEATYLAAIEAAGGAGAKPKAIMESLPPDAFKGASRDAHYKQIKRMREKLDNHCSST
jgi:hypothetical protein